MENPQRAKRKNRNEENRRRKRRRKSRIRGTGRRIRREKAAQHDIRYQLNNNFEHMWQNT